MFKLFIAISLILFITVATPVHAQTKYGFEGNEFDSQVEAYGSGKRSYPQFVSPISYFLKINKIVSTQKSIYMVRFIVSYDGSWRRYESATKKGGEHLKTTSVLKEVTTCGSTNCWYIEIFDVELSKEDFLSGIAFQVNGFTNSFVFKIPEAEAARVQAIADERFPAF